MNQLEVFVALDLPKSILVNFNSAQEVDEMILSKLDVAKRQLEFSIRLFFLSGDPVVAYLTVAASLGVLRDLCKREQLKTFQDEFLSHVKVHKRAEIRKILNAPYNFMKHADIDSTATLDFKPIHTNIELWEAVELYYKLTGEVTGLMQSMRLWLYLKYPDYIEDETGRELMKKYSKIVDLKDSQWFLNFAAKRENARIT